MQSEIFFNGDSKSFIWAFRNWWHLGRYTFDLQQPDAAFGRLPGYPLFYGVHYLLAGRAWAGLAVACTQAVFDSCSALLVFGSVRRLVMLLGPAAGLGAWVPYAGGLLYATYPFTIVWVPIVGTETMATFLTLAWLGWLLRPARTTGYFVGLGLWVAAAFYVREYLGVLLPVTCAYLLASWPAPASVAGRGRVAALLLVCGTFGVLYVLWPVRNYAVAHRLVLLKPLTAGYANLNVDIVSFRNWVLCWSPDEETWLDAVATSRNVAFPAEVFATAQEARQAHRAAQLAHDCGSSFAYRQIRPPHIAPGGAAEAKAWQQRCDAEIEATFVRLKASYVARHPVRYWLGVPAQNLAKAFFKATKATKNEQPGTRIAKALLTRGLFAWRSLLVVLGFAGLLRYHRQRGTWPVAFFVGFMYLFMCVLVRKLEMRYLLQADALLLVPAALMLGGVANWLRPRPQGTRNRQVGEGVA
ncbi:glycosyltransferase family protein [Hymenobacter armeniacus]|uniref:Glycosyltransferase RgtA/B/C/D-like domain-containing protein n=1 Tax=Hymenobacter armeniacus TaxID=2771358 RepID=A0ABR8JSF9_9BACT|nr:hypothetical protein [Hymenobacter armeniacus]MBD2721555.1 hypothetical protein [Hymenobacter armeniacus]